jgi:hypothetical protein
VQMQSPAAAGPTQTAVATQSRLMKGQKRVRKDSSDGQDGSWNHAKRTRVGDGHGFVLESFPERGYLTKNTEVLTWSEQDSYTLGNMALNQYFELESFVQRGYLAETDAESSNSSGRTDPFTTQNCSPSTPATTPPTSENFASLDGYPVQWNHRGSVAAPGSQESSEAL